jgi:hypothetical protein
MEVVTNEKNDFIVFKVEKKKKGTIINNNNSHNKMNGV